jgi:hypothetical protein
MWERPTERPAESRAGASGTRTGEGGAGTEPSEEEPEASPLEGRVGGKETDGGLSRCVHTCPGSNSAPTLGKVMARRPLLVKAGAGEGVVGAIQEDGEPTGTPNQGGVRRSGGKTELKEGRGRPESERVSGQELGSLSNQIEAGPHAQE